MTLATNLPSAGVLVLAVFAAAAVIGALAMLMRRHQDALPLLAVFALPFRVPISSGGRTVNLLVPLYLVVAAGFLAVLLPAVLEARRRGSLRVPRPRRELAFWGTPAGMTWLLKARVALYALQSDLLRRRTPRAAENLAVLLPPLRRCCSCSCAMVRWTPRAAAAMPRRRGRRWRSCSPGWASSSTTASRCS